jgi:hypothetical protein
MRRIALVALSAALAGCLELEVAVTLAPNGSGEQRFRLGLPERTLDRLVLAAKATGSRDPLDVFDERKVRDDIDDDHVDVAEFRAWRERDSRFVEVRATFDRLERLRRSELLGGKCEWFVLTGRNPGGIRVVVYPQGHAAFLAAIDKARALRAEPEEVQQQFFAAQRERLTGLDVTFRIDLPGDVDYCSTNLRRTGTRQVEGRVRAGDIETAEALVRALAPRFEVEFDGRTCTMDLDADEPPPPPRPTSGDPPSAGTAGSAR